MKKIQALTDKIIVRILDPIDAEKRKKSGKKIILPDSDDGSVHVGPKEHVSQKMCRGEILSLGDGLPGAEGFYRPTHLKEGQIIWFMRGVPTRLPDDIGESTKLGLIVINNIAYVEKESDVEGMYTNMDKDSKEYSEETLYGKKDSE